MEPGTSHSNDEDEKLVTSVAEPLWTVEDVANYLRLKKETVRLMARNAKIPAFKVGKVWRFRANEIKGMLKSLSYRSN